MKKKLKVVDINFASELRSFYESVAIHSIDRHLMEMIEEAGKEIAREIMDKYELRQQLVEETGVGLDKQIILTTVLQKRHTDD